MASSKEYLDFIQDQLSELEDISYRAMMGEFILYYQGKVICGIYDDRLLVKPTKSAAAMMPDAPAETPGTAPAQSAPLPAGTEAPAETEAAPDEDGSYTTKEDVALYLHTYGHLPPNFITKKEAEKAGWTGGSLDRVLPGMCIGGDYFGNYEGKLPKAKGRKWAECDINTLGARSRGPERIIFSNDGLIYYTPDHYESFELLYE